jgi:hypothetical protein
MLGAALACALILNSASPSLADASARSLHIDRCLVIAVEMMDTVDSGDALPGDFFRFQTVNAVTSGKNVVIPARTMGYGVVAVASPAGRGGRPGVLVLEPKYLELPSGDRLGVVLDHDAGELSKSGPTGDLPGYLGAIPVLAVGAVIGIFNYFHNGKNIQVKRGMIFPIFPSDDPEVEACQSHPQL